MLRLHRPARLLAAAVLLAAACSTASTPMVEPTAPLATATQAPPTATVSEATSAPEATATSEPAATAASQATPTAEATATTEPTATPGAINPLTGLPVADPAALDRRPLAIKIAHFPRGVREFQVGLSAADNVWEHYAEGGTTRFTAVFLSEGPDRIGNVRSARLIDVHLGQAYQAMLVASGSSSGTMARLRETDFYDRIIAEYTGYSECPLLCREESAAVTSHKLFTSGRALWDLAEELGLGGGQDLPGFEFAEAPPPGGEPVTTIHIDFHQNFAVAEWRYDPASGRYARWIDTDAMPELAPHVDTANGEALAASTVVVVFVPYLPANVREEEGGRVFYSYDVPLYGRGPAYVFRDGQMYEATWERDEEAGGLPRLLDADGSVIPFRPGVVWFDVLDPDSVTRIEDGLFYARIRVPPPIPAE